MFRPITLTAALLALSACSGSPSTGPAAFDRTDIATPAFDGNSGTITIADLDALSFSNRVDPSLGLVYSAQILPGALQVPAPTTGKAVMTGPFALRQVSGLTRTGTTYSGTARDVTGLVTLTADFGAGTLKGSGDGLAINGTLTGDTLAGTATYAGIPAKIQGTVGATNAIGVFAGKTTTASVAGGFAVVK